MFAFTTVPLPSTIYIPSLSPLVKLVVVPLSLVRVFALASLLVKPWSVTVKDSGEDFDAGDVPAISLSDAHPANTSGRMAAMIILAIFFITVSVFLFIYFLFTYHRHQMSIYGGTLNSAFPSTSPCRCRLPSMSPKRQAWQVPCRWRRPNCRLYPSDWCCRLRQNRQNRKCLSPNCRLSRCPP